MNEWEETGGKRKEVFKINSLTHCHIIKKKLKQKFFLIANCKNFVFKRRMKLQQPVH